MTLEAIVSPIITVIFTFGVVLALVGVINALMMIGAKKTKAEIIDYVQEFTSRGFLWRAKLSYEFNDIPKEYVMRSRTARRSSGTITIFVTKHGRVVEIGKTIEDIIFGIAVILLAAVVRVTIGM